MVVTGADFSEDVKMVKDAVRLSAVARIGDSTSDSVNLVVEKQVWSKTYPSVSRAANAIAVVLWNLGKREGDL